MTGTADSTMMIGTEYRTHEKVESLHKKHEEVTRYGVLPSTISLEIREPGSALTHLFGLFLVVLGSWPLMARVRANGSVYTAAGMITFLITTCLLYAASTTYHTVVLNEKKTTIFRKMDHISISIMIAGTYTPICLTALRGTAGFLLLITVWALAAAAVILKLFWITCPKIVSSLIYVAMGWACIFALPALLNSLSGKGFLWLLAGGIFYTVGAVIYAMHPKDFDAKHIYFGSHEIFHVFIMLGTFCHYMLMYNYIAFIR